MDFGDNMTQSERFQKLKEELERLKNHLLPAHFDPEGDYSLEVSTKAIGYRVLAHAELENFIEDMSWEAALKSVQNFKKKGLVTKTLLGLVAFSGTHMEPPPNSLVPDQETKKKFWDSKIQLETKIDKAIKAYRHSIQTNHGIKEENILKLLLPIGIEAEGIDPVWLANINSFSETRGEAAHLSHRDRINNQINPEDELNRVKQILEGLKDIDDLITGLFP